MNSLLRALGAVFLLCLGVAVAAPLATQLLLPLGTLLVLVWLASLLLGARHYRDRSWPWF